MYAASYYPQYKDGKRKKRCHFSPSLSLSLFLSESRQEEESPSRLSLSRMEKKEKRERYAASPPFFSRAAKFILPSLLR